MNILFGATVFFHHAKDFVLVQKVAEQYPWLKYVEFRGEFPFLFPDFTSMEELTSFKTILRKNNIRSTIHTTMYDINLATLNPWVKEGNIACYKKFVDVASFLESDLIVVHAGYLHTEYATGPQPDKYRALAEKQLCESLYELAEYGQSKQVKIAVENAPIEENFPIIDNAETHLRILNAVNHSYLGALLDFAHALLRKVDILPYLEAIRPHLLEIHAHNNWGEKDDHLGLHHGVIDYRSILEHPDIRGVPFIMEIHSYEEVIQTLTWLEKTVKGLSRDDG